MITLLTLFSMFNVNRHNDVIWIIWLILSGINELSVFIMGYVRATYQKKELENRARLYFEDKDAPKNVEINSIDENIPVLQKS